MGPINIKLTEIKMGNVKRIAIFLFLAIFLLVIIFQYIFLMSKILANKPYENSLRSQIKNFVNRITVVSKLNKEELEKELDLLNKRFPKEEEIPTLLDELEQLGRKAEVKITLIGPQKLEQPVTVDFKFGGDSHKFEYKPLLLTINLTCSYLKLAQFLESLDNWSRGVVIVRGFGIQRDEVIPENIKVDNLVIQVVTISSGNE